MNIYHVTALHKCDQKEIEEFVLIHESEDEAVKMAYEYLSDHDVGFENLGVAAIPRKGIVMNAVYPDD